MVTVKEEVPVESVVLGDTQQFDFDHFKGPGHPFDSPTVAREQPPWSPWSHPGPVGPQESYEAEYQVPRPAWFPPPNYNPQPKPDNRTVPTMLDQYQMQLAYLEQENKQRNGGTCEEQGSNVGPPSGWLKFLKSDCQTQLRLLEEQNKTRIPMLRQQPVPGGSISGRDWIPPPGWRESLLPEYQEALKYLEEEHKTRLTSARDGNENSMGQPTTTSRGTSLRLISEGNGSEGMPSPPTIPDLSYGAHGDYQMQLMLLEQQNKKRLMLVRGAQDAPAQHAAVSSTGEIQMQLMLREQQNKKLLMMGPQEQDARACQNPPFGLEVGSGDREQSVESNSTWTTQFTPESTPGFQDGRGSREPSMGPIGQIQLNFPQSHQPDSDLCQGPLCNCPISGQILRDHLNECRGLKQYQEALMLKEQRNRASMEMWPGEYKEPERLWLQDYQMQLMLLEQQNKRRKMSERQEEGHQKVVKRQSENDRNARQDYEMQLMLLEKQNKKRLMMARQEDESQGIARAEQAGEWVLNEQKGGEEPAWITTGSRDLHKRPLVIRERPTCDD